MKKFSFPLERARTWKRSLWERQEIQLERLFAQLHLIERRRVEVSASVESAAQSLTRRPELTAEDLGQLGYVQRYGKEEDRRLAERQQKAAAEVETQRGVVREARRQYELLERLKEAQFQQWSHDLAHEQETQIGELTIARWRRDRGEI